jgi:hypothetical protein
MKEKFISIRYYQHLMLACSLFFIILSGNFACNRMSEAHEKALEDNSPIHSSGQTTEEGGVVLYQVSQ